MKMKVKSIDKIMKKIKRLPFTQTDLDNIQVKLHKKEPFILIYNEETLYKRNIKDLVEDIDTEFSFSLDKDNLATLFKNNTEIKFKDGKILFKRGRLKGNMVVKPDDLGNIDIIYNEEDLEEVPKEILSYFLIPNYSMINLDIGSIKTTFYSDGKYISIVVGDSFHIRKYRFKGVKFKEFRYDFEEFENFFELFEDDLLIGLNENYIILKDDKELIKVPIIQPEETPFDYLDLIKDKEKKLKKLGNFEVDIEEFENAYNEISQIIVENGYIHITNKDMYATSSLGEIRYKWSTLKGKFKEFILNQGVIEDLIGTFDKGKISVIVYDTFLKAYQKDDEGNEIEYIATVSSEG